MKTNVSKWVVTSVVVTIMLSANVSAQTKGEATVSYKANVTCESCKNKIEKNMAYEKGVTAVNADVDADIVTVTYKLDKTDPGALSAALAKIGYENQIVGGTAAADTTSCKRKCCAKSKMDSVNCKNADKKCCAKTREAGK